jgi:hypothetical protein
VRLSCNVPEQGIEADDQFTFNDEFSSKFKRIKVPLISAREVNGGEGGPGGGAGGEGALAGGDGVGGDVDNLPATVEEERRHHVEAAIVRIMKARKTLSHNELVMEVTRQLAVRFTPNPQVHTQPRYIYIGSLIINPVFGTVLTVYQAQSGEPDRARVPTARQGGCSCVSVPGVMAHRMCCCKHIFSGVRRYPSWFVL